MWRLSALFLTLSLAMMVWIGYELEVFGAPAEKSSASDTTTGLATLKVSLDDKAKELAKKEGEVKLRERSIGEKEALLTQQLNRYEKVIQGLKAKVAELEAHSENRGESFRQIYEKMEPKRAAKIIDEMDLDSANQILMGMQKAKAAEILARMSPERARAITEKGLGKRHLANAPVSNVSQPGQ